MKPIGVISTDWHIELSNIEQSEDLAAQLLTLMQQLKVKEHYLLGDVFESRKAQPQESLNCFGRILDRFHEAGIRTHLIPGNHDKTEYSSHDSFLDPFKNHPGLNFCRHPTYWVSHGLGMVFIPFYDTELWVEEYKKLTIEPTFPINKCILLSHQAINGSKNNNGSKVESSITAGLLKDWKAVYLGHYHNAQQPAPNVFHLSSWKQKDFGEDDQKGFHVLMEGGTVEFHKSKFKEFVNLDLNAGKVDAGLLKDIEGEFKSNNIHLKVNLTGTDSEIKSLNLSSLKQLGIKVNPKSMEVEASIEKALVGETVDLSKDETIVTFFECFCQERGFDYDKGMEYLKDLLYEKI